MQKPKELFNPSVIISVAITFVNILSVMRKLPFTNSVLVGNN